MIISIWLIVALWQKYLHGYCKEETDVYAVSKKARVGSCLGSDKKKDTLILESVVVVMFYSAFTLVFTRCTTY